MNALIIGAGVIGLSIARELHRRGMQRITLFDQASAGRESSWAAAGMLAPHAEMTVIDELYRMGIESLGLYPDFAAELRSETGIDVELNTAGTLEVALSDREMSSLLAKRELQSTQGVGSDLLTREGLLGLEINISEKAIGGIRYSGDHQVDNRKLVTALIEYCRRNDVRIIENARIEKIVSAGNCGVSVHTNSRSFSADVTIIATGAWTSLIEFEGLQAIKGVKPIKGQMIAFAPKEKLLTNVVYGSSCYLVPRADDRILVGATVEDVGFAKGVTDSAVFELSQSARKVLPGLNSCDISESWSGLRPVSSDRLPIIGKLHGSNGILVATAHYRNGILLAPMTAKIVADSILETAHSQFLDVFSPDRFAGSLANVIA